MKVGAGIFGQQRVASLTPPGITAPDSTQLFAPEEAPLAYPRGNTHAIKGIIGLLAWYDALDSSSIVNNGAGKCSQIIDKSNNGRHLTQSTDSKRPSIVGSLINSKPGLSFDGSDDFMECPTFDESVLGQESGYTLFTVLRLKTPDPTTGSTSNQLMGFGGVPTSTDRGKFILLQPRDTPLTIYSQSQGTGASSDAQDTSGIPFVYHETGAAGTNGALNWYINNVNKKSVATSITSRVNINQSYFHLHLGADPAVSTRCGIMDFGELIIFNRVLNSSEQSQVHNFLKLKWGI